MAADRRVDRHWLRLSLRARLTLVATTLVAVGLAAGALLLAGVLQRSLLRAIDDSARQRATDVAALVDTGQLSDPIPVAGGTAAVQVIDAQHRVRAASAGGDHLVPMLEPGDVASVRAGRALFLDGGRLGLSDPLRVVGARAGPHDDPQTVLVAISTVEASGSLRVVELALLVGAPLLLLGFGVACWFLVGSALRPVASLRQGAEEITGARAARRLPVPAADDEVRRLAVTLNGMLDRLERSSSRQRAFVSDAAHELRTPLASARTQLEVARKHPQTGHWPDTADAVLEDVDRMSRLVDDLLLLARLDEGGAPRLHPSPVDLAELAGCVAARSPGPVRRTGDSPVVVEGDGDALSRVIGNLVGNAVRHARSAVRVDVRRDGDVAHVTVTDDGPGIAPADRERVFERFTRLDEARSRDAGGSGLGLPIVRELVRAHGGSVTLEDAEPGLRAVVCLPALPAP
jgi:signal transduction histidine kinase